MMNWICNCLFMIFQAPLFGMVVVLAPWFCFFVCLARVRCSSVTNYLSLSCLLSLSTCRQPVSTATKPLLSVHPPKITSKVIADLLRTKKLSWLVLVCAAMFCCAVPFELLPVSLTAYWLECIMLHSVSLYIYS